jgi:hypothetical protein
MNKGISILTSLILTCTLFAPGVLADDAESTVISLTDLKENIDYIFPSGGYLSGLADHSTWSEIERDTLSETSGVEVTYEALYDASPSLTEELPTINAYLIPFVSQTAAESQFEIWKSHSYFGTGEWEMLTEGKDYFSYYTTSSNNSDLVKYRHLEEASLHLVQYYDNIVMVSNFYRDGGKYVRGNVSSFLDYLENYEDTLAIMSELFIYSEEAMKFYLGSVYSTEGPEEFDYQLDSASYSLDLEENMPEHGTISLDVYIDDGSEIGTILDMSGEDYPSEGALKIRLNENAGLEVGLYADEASSTCKNESGWHQLGTINPLSLYQWQNITLSFGQATGFSLWVNGEKQDHCSVYTPRDSGPVYLGDYPGDDLADSFVGYIKDLTVSYSLDESGNYLDSLSGDLVFTDVSEAHRYAAAISYLKDEGIIEGYANGSFRPEQSINRVEILKMLLLGFGYDVPGDYSMPDLSDLDEEAWYLPYLNYAASFGIVQGYPDGTYLPSHSLNRVEFLKILLSAYGIILVDYPVIEIYPDTYVDAWYSPYVQYSKDFDLMDLDIGGNFNPGSEVTRGEVAETIYRLIAG